MKEQLTLDWRRPGIITGGVYDIYEMSIHEGAPDKNKRVRYVFTFRGQDVLKILSERIVFAIAGDCLLIKGAENGYKMSPGAVKNRKAKSKYVTVSGANAQGLEGFLGDYVELHFDKRNNCFYVRNAEAENKNKNE